MTATTAHSDPLVRVDHHDPMSPTEGHRVLALLDEALPRVDLEPAGQGLRDLPGPILAPGIHDDHLVRPGHALQSILDPILLVLDDQGDRDGIRTEV